MTEVHRSLEAEHVNRVSVPELDGILGIPMKVLDDGFIRVVDYMGGDVSVVQAARVSYGKGTKHTSEDRGLIRYLMRHRHSTPFEMAEIKLHVRVPMDCWRQWIRHRTASVNEYSTRYSEAIDANQRTSANEWRSQASNNKQGSAGFLDEDVGTTLTLSESALLAHAHEVYQSRLSHGVAREQARKDLPLSTYTEAYWKVNLHNLLHFLGLRMEAHAQKEIRDYAEVIGNDVVALWCPLTWEAFLDYRLEAQSFSRLELEMLRLMKTKHREDVIAFAKVIGWWFEPDTSGRVKPHRERDEFIAKAEMLGYKFP